MTSNTSNLTNNLIIERLNALEQRIAQLEVSRKANPIPVNQDDPPELFEQFKDFSVGSVFESKVGEYGLAWLGNIVLFFGIIFLVEYIQSIDYQVLSSVFGYLSVAGIFILAHYLKAIYPKIAATFNLNGYLLLFYVTLSLHFFTNTPLVGNQMVGISLIALVVFIQLFISFKKNSTVLFGIGLFLLSIVAVVSNIAYITLSIAVIIAGIAVYFLFRAGWVRLLNLSMVLVYLINLIYFMNNPFMGNQLQAITAHNFGYIYLFVVGAIFSLIAFTKESEIITKNRIVSSIVINGIGFSFVLSLYMLSFFKEDYYYLMGSISVYCLLYSVLLKIKSDWKITAALYALFGFVTMSVMVHGIYEFPRAYFLLALQSFLVVSMAIWFRSKFIVMMNTLLFLTLVLIYLSTSELIDGVNISYSLVALLTARLLNWKRDRLTIKTNMLRNVYLLIGFVMVLITLYHLIPDRYITLSWTLAALLYFLLSLILKNVKYRYMALGTMLAAAFYLFIVDLARIGLVYRIIALMGLAIISIGLSIYYSKKMKKKQTETTD